MRSPEGYYRQRLSELALRGMASEALSCRISSTAVCVEVRPRRGLGGGRGCGRDVGGCWATPLAVLGAHLRAGTQALSPGLEGQVNIPHARLYPFIKRMIQGEHGGEAVESGPVPCSPAAKGRVTR